MLEELHITTSDIMDLSIKDGHFIISPKRKHIPTMDELFAHYTGEKQKEIDWGDPTGHEGW